jgi:ABC-type branched-subunit amino acid transport system ATPase component
MTIRIHSSGPFGPFSNLDVHELPDFVVLTGDNGSGKTQLLGAVANGTVVAAIDGVTLPKTDILSAAMLEPKLDLAFPYGQVTSLENQAVEMFRGSGRMMARPPRDQQPAVQLASKILGKQTDALVEDEIRAFALDVSQSKTDVSIAPNLARTSAAFLRRWYWQERAKIALKMGHQEMASLAELGQGASRTPPWLLISEMLAPFGFSLTGPEIDLKSAEGDIHLTFRNANGQSVQPSQLSGGEKCLLSLALEQYKVESGVFPKLLLLDESLAPLHPTVVRNALRTVRDVLWEQRRIRIIIVTHSPTLVALAEEDSLFRVARIGSTLKIEKASTDDTIAQLTVAVPTIRFDPLNRRQIFVEAALDEFIYQRLYQALRQRIPQAVSLQFIPAGKDRGSGGCDGVKILISRLRDNGVPTAHGILDWDGYRKSDPTNGIAVVAEGVRYAIENLVLDPLLLVLALSQTEKGRARVGGLTPSKVLRLASQDLSSLQEKVNSVVNAVDAKLAKIEECTMANVAYVGGFALTMPSWVLKTRGKEYAKAVIEAFPELKEHRAGPNSDWQDKLMAAIAANFSMEWQECLPVDCLDVFQRIASQPAVT